MMNERYARFEVGQFAALTAAQCFRKLDAFLGAD